MSEKEVETSKHLVVRALWNKQTQTVLSFVVALLLWELIVRIFHIRAYILPPPTEIIIAIVKYITPLLNALLYTARSLLIGYVIAVAAGVLLALPVAFSRFIQRAVYPLIVVSQLVPKVALAPIFVIWFGFGLLPKIMIVFLLSFFPIVLNGIVGLRSIDSEIISLTRSTGARAVDVFFKVRLPSALPTFFAGFKLAAISATVGAVIGEFIGSDAGLGYIILTANGDMQTDYSFAAIVCLTVLGLLLYFAVEFIERLVLPWHISQRTTDYQGS
ncbi:ABC transporter permease [Salinispira pacifica]